MHIGNAYYNCSCVRYVTSDDRGLTVGLAIGLGLPLIIITVVIIIMVVVCCRRHNKAAQDKVVYSANGGASTTDLYQNDTQYCITPGAENGMKPYEYCDAKPITLDEK